MRVCQFRHIRGRLKSSRAQGARTMTGLKLTAYVAAAALSLLPSDAVPAPAALDPPRLTEVVVTLKAPPLARAAASNRSLAASATRARRLNLRAPASAAYLRRLAAAQRALERRIIERIPTARVRWRYRVVLNGLAVVVPAGQLRRLHALPGVAGVYPSVRYRALLDRSPAAIGAPAVWGRGLASAGNGIKIGIIDDGVDQRHPFFSAAGLAMPPGFPKGRAAYTTAKVIVARAFPPSSPAWRYAARPLDPTMSYHGTHVAGIAAGANGVRPGRRRATVSGLAPRAYLGNYKVLTIPTISGVGLDGNAPEIAAGIEAAVRDGMDVINLSLGEPEIEPARDLVVEAINGAADAGVVPTIAAGNDFTEFGRGSISSPGSAAKAITAGAVTKAGVIADISSSGPTPLSLRLKPDVAAPGVEILSSVPARTGLWAAFTGTSMAAPHAAGAAAVLRQRHPSWTVAQLKSALVLTADPVYTSSTRRREVAATREGGGLINLPRADRPLVFAQPTSVSFGLVRKPRRGRASARTVSVSLADAGGGAGIWSVALEAQSRSARAALRAPAAVTVPGRLDLTASVAAGAPEKELTGFVVLRRGAERRRLPYWFRVTAPRLGRARHRVLRRTGTYRGNTRGKPARVDAYRYPDNPRGAGIPSRLRGPELVFRVRLRRPVANFGVAVLRRGRGVRIQPRIVAAGDENRQTGYTALPLNLNPYLASFQEPRLVAGVVRPARGAYDVVFDTPSRAAAGRFRFRFWIGDTTPPRVRLLSRSIKRGERVRLAVTDAGAGVDRASLVAVIDGRARAVAYSRRTRLARVRIGRLPRGVHRLVFQASDHQEAKNMENVPQILPNTRQLRTTFRVR